MKKYSIIGIIFFLFLLHLSFIQTVIAGDNNLINLHCISEKGNGSRNIAVEKQGNYMISHEGDKVDRNDGSVIGIDKKTLKKLNLWVYAKTGGKTYDFVSIFNPNKLSYAPAGFKKGNFEKAYKLFEKNGYFCVPFKNPFEK